MATPISKTPALPNVTGNAVGDAASLRKALYTELTRAYSRLALAYPMDASERLTGPLMLDAVDVADFPPAAQYPGSLIYGADSTALYISNGTVWNSTPIGGPYQPLDSDLTAIAALGTQAYGRSLLTLTSAAALGAELSGIYQPLDSDLTAIAALTTTSYGRGLLTLADAAAGRTALGLGTMAVQNANAVAVTGGTVNGLSQFSTSSTTAPLDSDAQYYFADYDCWAANIIRFDWSTSMSGVSGGGFRDALFIDVRESDFTDYTLIGQKVTYGIRSYVMSTNPATAHYKDFTAGTFECVGRIEWPNRGVSGVTASAIQYGSGIASNEFYAGNPASATNASLSMAALQPQVFAGKQDNDGTHKYYTLLATNLGGRITAAFAAITNPNPGYTGYFQYGMDFSVATIEAGGAAIRFGAASDGGNAGTVIQYDSNDYSAYALADNFFYWIIGGSYAAALGTQAVFSQNTYTPLVTQVAGANVTPRLQVLGTDNPTSALMSYRASADTGGPIMYFAKSRNATIGSHTVVQNNDGLGSISWAGSDGSAMAEAARIGAFVDGTPGANDMPGRLVFMTSPDGTDSPIEALRINAIQQTMFSAPAVPLTSGLTTLGTTSLPWDTLFLKAGGIVNFGNGQASIYNATTNVLTFYTNSAERWRIDARGDLMNSGLTSSFGTSGGRKFLTLVGETERGVLQLASSATEAEFKNMGHVEWWDAVNNFRVGYMLCLSRGSTANNRGASFVLGVKQNGSSTIVETLLLDEKANVVLGTNGALATNATDGFTWIGTCAGTPTGTPNSTWTGVAKAPLVINTTNNKLYFYSGGAWRDAGP